MAAPGVTLALGGVAIGSVVALPIGRVLRTFVWGVSETDAITFAAVGLTLVTVAVVASLVPALRVLRLDPAVTLRQE